jgi:ParB family chromosome partitioning protein
MQKKNLNKLIENTKIQYLKIDEVKPYTNNPRKIKNVDKVANSISEFGFQQPIVVDKNNIIIVGHTRYQASKKLGLDKIPVLVAELTDKQAKAYRIIDNRLNEDNEWDKDLLNIEIEDLKYELFDIKNFGFDDTELENLLRDSDQMTDTFLETKAEPVQLSKLKPHPKHYKVHLDDQLVHLANSIKQNGFYRNIVVASDYTILDGHGVVSACHKLNLKEVPVIKFNIDSDSPQALKILTGNNEIGKLAEIDDRKLTELLKEVKDRSNLEGTGYNEMMLANLVMVTRPANEIASISEAAEWIGMPDYEPKENSIKINIQFRNHEDRNTFITLSKMKAGKENGYTWSYWWPHKEKDDMKSIKFDT